MNKELYKTEEGSAKQLEILEVQKQTFIDKATSKLKNFTTFREQNEKKFIEKAEKFRTNQEIRKPLDDALFEIKSLTGKLQRREEYIRELRRRVTIESLIQKLEGPSSDDNLDMNDEGIRLMEAKDECSRLMDAMTVLKEEKQELQHKLKIEHEFRLQTKIKDQKREYALKEKMRDISRDKETSVAFLNQKEHTVERLLLSVPPMLPFQLPNPPLVSALWVCISTSKALS